MTKTVLCSGNRSSVEDKGEIEKAPPNGSAITSNESGIVLHGLRFRVYFVYS